MIRVHDHTHFEDRTNDCISTVPLGRGSPADLLWLISISLFKPSKAAFMSAWHGGRLGEVGGGEEESEAWQRERE